MRHAASLLVISRLSMTCLRAAIAYAAIRAGSAACSRTSPIDVRPSVAAAFGHHSALSCKMSFQSVALIGRSRSTEMPIPAAISPRRSA